MSSILDRTRRSVLRLIGGCAVGVASTARNGHDGDDGDDGWTGRGDPNGDGAEADHDHGGGQLGATEPLASVRSGVVRPGDTVTFGHALEDTYAGHAAGRKSLTQANRIHEAVARHPVDKETSVITLMTENGQNPVYENLFPLMRDRGLPFWVGTNPYRIQHDDDYVDLEQYAEMVAHGAEVGLYTGLRDKPDFSGNLDDAETLEELERILLGQKRDMEEMGLQVSFISPNRRDGLTDGQLDEAAYRMARSAYVGSIHGYQRGTKAVFKRKLDAHGTIADMNLGDPNYPSADEVKSFLDRLADSSVRAQLWWHTWAIQGENGGWDRMAEILDYIAELRDAGDLEVATPTGGYSIPWDLPEGNVLVDSDASYADDFADGMWSSFGGTPEVRTDGGHVGDNYWALGRDPTGSRNSGMRDWSFPVNPAYNNAMLRFHARAPPGSGTATVRTQNTGFRHEDFDGSHEQVHTVGEEWEAVYRPIGWPRNDVGDASEDGLHELVIWTDDDEVHVDDVRLYPI